MENLCECTVSQVKIETHRNVHLCTRVDRLSPWSDASSRGEAESWSRHIDEDTFGIYYTLANQAGEAYPYRYPRPLKAIRKEEAQMLQQSDPAILKNHRPKRLLPPDRSAFSTLQSLVYLPRGPP